MACGRRFLTALARKLASTSALQDRRLRRDLQVRFSLPFFQADNGLNYDRPLAYAGGIHETGRRNRVRSVSSIGYVPPGCQGEGERLYASA